MVCRGYHGTASTYSCQRHEELCGLCGPKLFAQFVACGGSASLDADTNYPVNREHQALSAAPRPESCLRRSWVPWRRPSPRPTWRRSRSDANSGARSRAARKRPRNVALEHAPLPLSPSERHGAAVPAPKAPSGAYSGAQGLRAKEARSQEARSLDVELRIHIHKDI